MGTNEVRNASQTAIIPLNTAYCIADADDYTLLLGGPERILTSLESLFGRSRERTSVLLRRLDSLRFNPEAIPTLKAH